MSISWQDLQIAPDRTHHLLGERAAYVARFDEVLKFHAPGLAPVRDASGAYHISATGRAAYSQRYLRTFGFYQDRATVQATDGWFHILPDGAPLYGQRYDWCGNYQEELCTVRARGGTYCHLTARGALAYPERYSYAGDFRDGIAVIQEHNGLHTHIDRLGEQVHGCWFVDLDVFHKGFARARDASGWHHIDLRGVSIYTQRFAAVEPFYNGQARVEDFSGSLLVIDELGNQVVQLRSGMASPS
jgi:hypothetical protein